MRKGEIGPSCWRSTFLIDENGVIQEIWRKVKVPGHVDAVKESLQASAKAA